MTRFGYHAAHEQHSPSALLAAVVAADSAGFEGAMCSDHLAPWTPAQGHAGFAWSWLGAALGATSSPFSIGVVTAPGQRYHPAILAQAIATLGEMHPGRFWAALGSGEALNEHVTGAPWPPKSERERRLSDCVAVIRALLAGDRISVDGPVRVHEARIWGPPTDLPPLLAAAGSPWTAAAAAAWSDGLVTTGVSPIELAGVLAAYEAAGGRGPRMLQLPLALGRSDGAALETAAAAWGHSVVPAEVTWDLEQPEDFERLSADPDETALRDAVLIADDPDELVERIAELAALEFDWIHLHDVSDDQLGFVAFAGAELLPAVRSLLPAEV